MGGFKHRNREVITHSELTLQMDELLECALPRLRVRKLHTQYVDSLAHKLLNVN